MLSLEIITKKKQILIGITDKFKKDLFDFHGS